MQQLSLSPLLHAGEQTNGGGGRGDSMVGQLDYLLKMVTAARREGLGDLVWRSYDAFKKKRGFRRRPCHASRLAAVSAGWRQGLVDIVADPAEFGVGFHFDVLLLRHMAKRGNEFRWRTCTRVSAIVRHSLASRPTRRVIVTVRG